MIALAPFITAGAGLTVRLVVLQPPHDGVPFAAALDATGTIVPATAATWDGTTLTADFAALPPPAVALQLRLRGDGQTVTWAIEATIEPAVFDSIAPPPRAVRTATVIWPSERTAPFARLGGDRIFASDSYAVLMRLGGDDSLSAPDIKCKVNEVSGLGIVENMEARLVRIAWGAKKVTSPGVADMHARIETAEGVHAGRQPLFVEPSILPPPVAGWLLADGSWDDDANWDDTESWNDGD